MNEKALRVLEYPKIIARLVDYASTPQGKVMAEKLVPMTEKKEIEQAQAETADALQRVFRFGSLSLSGVKDIRDSMLRLQVGSSLGAPELLRICALLKVAARAKTYGRREELDQDEKDSLDDYFTALEPLTPLAKELERCILSEEEIADDASSNLKSIRRKKQTTEAKIHTEMNSILNSSRTYLQDGVITMRNGRYCLPVKQEQKNNVPGMIHDQSGSGSTVFIEPMAVVKLNNEIRQLEIEEQKEIEVILSTLSEQAAVHQEELEMNFRILTLLDFIFAKARLAREMDGSRPEFNNRGYINIKKGRHPLLDKKKVVPIDISLGDSYHQLIITGPNTGGKTVSLKTLGLFCLMGQAGLHIPAFQGSSLTIFTEVYADIGDEQSIEQSLSTFSSHMTNIVHILDKADKDSLVLFDELCAGTDPTEGAALAIAILQFLHRMQVRTMATTHYSELKVYALSEEGVENASCEFNVETLSPTYRLLVGIPGKSNAFAISQKLGLPAFIIEDAKVQIDAETESFEDVIARLEESRVTIEKEEMEINRMKAEVKSLEEKLKAKEDRLDTQRDKIISEAKAEARNLLQAAKNQADETIRMINKYGSTSEATKILEKERAKLRTEIDKSTTGLPKKKETGNLSPKSLKIGDGVRVLSMGLNGTVNSLPDAKGNLFVTMGILRSQVNISDLAKLNETTVKMDNKPVSSGTKKFSGSMGFGKSATISPEINLIGKTVDEAIAELDKYLDDAYLSHLPQVRVVHGRGTGALRNGIHKHLKKLPYISEFRLGEYGEGDTGVTIVKFK